MKFLDSTWWNATDKLIGIQPDSGNFRVMLLQKDQAKITVIAHHIFDSTTELSAYLEEQAGIPLLLHLEGEYIFERITPNDPELISFPPPWV